MPVTGKTVKLEAGRELDALMAEKVMVFRVPTYALGDGTYSRWSGDKDLTKVETGETISQAAYWDSFYWQDNNGTYFKDPQPYSTSISSAMEVDEEMDRRGFVLELKRFRSGNCAARYLKVPPMEWMSHEFWMPPGIDGVVKTPLAICRAALKAVESL